MARLILFDMDGTLFDTAEDLVRAVVAAFVGEGLPQATVGPLKPFAGHGLRALVRAAFEQLGPAAGEAPDERMVERLCGRALDLYAEGLTRHTLPYPGALAALDRLRARGDRLAILSNKTGRFARALLDHFAIADRFCAVSFGDSHSFNKPDARAVAVTVAAATRAAGEDFGAVVLVGDSDVDITTARNAGIAVVAVTHGYMTTPVASFGPDAVIDHFDALDDAIDAALRRWATGR